MQYSANIACKTWTSSWF